MQMYIEANYHERLFLEAWHSMVDLNVGNDHIKIPEAYKCFARAYEFQKVTLMVMCTSLARCSFFFQIACNNERAFITDEGLSITRNV